MALQDLTPQLRTRLSRMERAVGWFVLLATALLAFGFGYYIYKMAERKGWFITKTRYFTFTATAAGLRIGDPVMLMGMEVGQILDIEPMDPYDPHQIYVEFEVKKPYYGYLWTEGSRAKINAADFLGKREVEVTKGVNATNGIPIYIFNPMRDLALTQAEALPASEDWRLAQDIYAQDANGFRIVMPAFAPVTNLAPAAALGYTNVRVFKKSEAQKLMTGVWNDGALRYDFYTRASKPYWLRSDESPAVTERLDKLVTQVENALPNFLALTNQIALVLSNGANLTSNLDLLAVEARPAASNLAGLSAQLRGPGALGDWLLGTNGQRQVGATLETVNATLSHTDTNLTQLVDELARSLDNLADITGNLKNQVLANSNILSSISKSIVDADDFVQGLKRHWLFRSAFRSKETNAPPLRVTPLRSPRDRGDQ